ncbi:MAG TPA: thiamine ABC transporter substrate-binding protein [Chloroflexi bacterium]|nr:thiamine ABC transporter substrate-binding protein [Chloroflexota bacterium]
MKKYSVGLVLLALLLAACAPATPAPTATPSGPRTLTIITHDSFDIGEETIAAFEAAHNAEVEILKSGDAGLMLNQAILSADNPLADVLYGVDNTLMSRGLEAGIFESYDSPLLAQVPNHLELDSEHRLLPVDYGDVCLNYDKAWFAEQDLEPPATLEDLTKPEYAGLTVVENPASSSPGLAFMLATIGHFGLEGNYTWLDFWADLRESDVLVTDGWEDAYWGHFTYASDGDRPVVVSYASSPPVEVYFSDEDFEEAPTGVVVAEGSCFRQIEFVGILRNTPDRDLAEAWVDFMLGTTFQEDIPLHMFVFPANEDAALPEVFARLALIPEHPARVDPADIEANRETWVEQWTETVLR